MRLGVHVSTAGNIYDAVDRARELGCTSMQIFSRNPQRKREVFLSGEDIGEFVARLKTANIKPFFIHAPYTVNLASPDKGLWKRSIKVYIEDIREAFKLRADYIVTHMGSHKETSEEEGTARFIQALNCIIEKTADTPVGLLLENVAGSGSWIGHHFFQQKQVIDALADKSRVGLCLDTAHAYSAGYDVATREGLKDVLDEIDALVGLDRLKLIHLNDTKDALGSHRDRHEHIGQGRIGSAGMKRIVTSRRLQHAAFILETPKDSGDSDRMNLEVVRGFMKKRPGSREAGFSGG
ncbi:MAG: deoxyribonuclease IV [Candidatus Omnitrophica bacterium]|nr:deoxyribonuclease IV [Candidatus Omnitrophota bacterium]